MEHRTDQPPDEPTPVGQDANATAAELLARAADDYRRAAAARQQGGGH